MLLRKTSKYKISMMNFVTDQQNIREKLKLHWMQRGQPEDICEQKMKEKDVWKGFKFGEKKWAEQY